MSVAKVYFKMALLWGLLSVAPLPAPADWPQFRGPGSLGISKEKGLPVTWSQRENIAWKAKLPGPGASSPIIVGDRIFVTCYSGYGLERNRPGDLQNLKRHLVCLDKSGGKIIWTRAVAALLPENPYANYVNLHGYASSTPVSDGKSVFVFFGKSGVFAFDLEGKELWRARLGQGTHGWGSATSAVLHKELLIINASVESGTLFALDKETGKEVWRAKGISESWSTPVLVQVPGGQTELVVSGSRKVLGFDPETGKELWHANSFTWYVCPSVVAHEGIVYALQNSTAVAVRAGGRGDVTQSHTLWQKKFGSGVSSPVYHEGHLYWAGNAVYCLRADDGTLVYRKPLEPAPDKIYASPMLADGKLYIVSRTAGAFVVQAGSKFRLLAHNTLLPDTGVFNGSPAVDRSQLFLRSDRFLYCIGKER